MNDTPCNDSEFVEVYRNHAPYRSALRELPRAGCAVLFALGLILLPTGAVVLHGLDAVGVVKLPAGREEDRPGWGSVLLVLFMIAAGFALLAEVRDGWRRRATARRWVRDNGPLPWVTGCPTFERVEGSLTGVTVGERYFSFRDASCTGGSAGDFEWGMTTSIRGELRAWYEPVTGMLVRAGYRAFSAEEVETRLDALIAAHRAWMPDMAGLRTYQGDNVKERDALIGFVAKFQKLVEDDCAALEALKPSLLPGARAGSRVRADEEHHLLLTRIEFNKSCVAKALRTARSWGY